MYDDVVNSELQLTALYLGRTAGYNLTCCSGQSFTLLIILSTFIWLGNVFFAFKSACAAFYAGMAFLIGLRWIILLFYQWWN